MNDNSSSGCAKIILIIGFIASLLTLFTFLTGIVSIHQISGWMPNRNSENNNTSSPQTSPISTKVPEKTPTDSSTMSSIGDWALIGLQGETISLIATGKGHLIYAGTSKNEHGVFKSSDDGENWSAKNNGLGELDIHHLVIAPDNPDKVIATTRNIIWISSDGGNSWNSTAPSTLVQDYPVALGSPDGTRLFAALQYTEMYESTNGGDSWEKIADFGYCNDLYSVLSTGRIYCLYKNWSPDSISRSDDNGRTWWKAASVGAQYDLTTFAVDVSNDSIIYVGTEGYGIYKSTDGGGSWSPINNTLPNQGHDLYITSIAVDPIASGTVFIGIWDYGIYKSTDAGQSWVSLTNGLAAEVAGKVLSLGLSIDTPRYLFAGTDSSGMLRYQLP